MAKTTPKRKKQRKGNKRQPQARHNWPSAIESIVGKAMARGQLVPLALSIILIIAVFRMPPDELVGFATDVLAGLKNGSYLGWIFFVLTLVVWKKHVKLIRKQASQEMERIGREKNRAQEVMLKNSN